MPEKFRCFLLALDHEPVAIQGQQGVDRPRPISDTYSLALPSKHWVRHGYLLHSICARPDRKPDPHLARCFPWIACCSALRFGTYCASTPLLALRTTQRRAPPRLQRGIVAIDCCRCVNGAPDPPPARPMLSLDDSLLGLNKPTTSSFDVNLIWLLFLRGMRGGMRRPASAAFDPPQFGWAPGRTLLRISDE
jgi:hypothetical protein